MRPKLEDETAEVVTELADKLATVDAETLTFDQRLRVVLKEIDRVEKGTSMSGVTEFGRIIAKLNEQI